MSDLGFITIARRDTSYSEMAVDLALSLRDFCSHPIALVADDHNAAFVQGLYPRVFDAIIPLPERYQAGTGVAAKYAMAELTPFSRTIFIDADTLVLSAMPDLLQEAARADVLMMGVYCDARSTLVHHGFSVRKLIATCGLDRYFKNHSGAFAFETKSGRDFFNECLKTYEDELCDLRRRSRIRRVEDEIPLGIVGGRRGVTIMREPFPIYWSRELAALRADNRWKPLCHFHNAPAPSALEWLMREVSQRRRAHGLPAQSTAAWLRKARSSQRKKALGSGIVSLYRAGLSLTNFAHRAPDEATAAPPPL
ncbi:hypothetical protein [Aquabacter spiritensis]|uniref:Glycosyl transferase family 8 n=1 Tax=Aquabacter spiritensis TaxID=933073 RepID=A0A4R3LSI5_9HYPH|nr:hypothetical protein [Aquabacter spiritensis]TCT03513.1 hypothetical protein EDC64_10963 [Aquabacter spiritensis]